MKFTNLLKLFLCCYALMSLMGCGGYTYAIPGAYIAASAISTYAGEHYEDVKDQVPQQSDNTTRIYIYRPQRLLGSAAKPVVIINGESFGDKNNPKVNLLPPASVFIVDSSAPKFEMWLFQNNKEEFDKKTQFRATPGKTKFFRLGMKSTYTFLEAVKSDKAIDEIQKLRLTGYKNLSKKGS